MWFDPYKLLASANFQDIPVDPALAETPGTAGAPATSGGLSMDALNQVNAPNPYVTGGSLFPGTTTSDPFSFGGIAATYPAGAGFADSATPAPDSTTTPAAPADTASNVPLPQPRPPSADAALKPDTGYSSEVDKITGAAPGRAQPTAAAGAGGGAAGANAMANLAKALQGVAQAAQGGNPQAMQLMNMLRQMQQMQQMGMMGGGQNFNPYMNQFMNPWAARHRMEQMRRQFMERQRLRQQLYGRTPGGERHGRR